MHLLILAVLAGLAAYWIVKQLTEQRRRRESLTTRHTRGHNVAPPHQRVPDDELERRADTLRDAVSRGDITEDEAVGSLVRLGGPAISEERARQLLREG